jgi:formylglycine-generating enzyme
MKIGKNIPCYLVCSFAGIAIALSCANVNEPNQAPPGLGSPTVVSILAGNQTVTISWKAVPGATSYAVYHTAGATITTVSPYHTCTDTSYAIGGLTNRTKYAFAVSAANALGESGLSTIDTATPIDPNQTALSLVPGESQMSLTWQSATSVGSYTVYWDTGKSITKSAPNKHGGAVSPYVITGLSNMHTYSFGVVAVRNGIESEFIASANSQPVPDIPAAPGIICIIAQDKAAKVYFDTVSWAISYRVYYATSDLVTPQSQFIESNTSPVTVSGLNNGTILSVVVAAINGLGMSSLPQPTKVEPRPASGSKMGMKLIPAGTFQMGSNDSVYDGALAYPAHTVTISSAFMMDSTEVTQEDYLRVLGVNPSSSYSYYGNLRRPVDGVTWHDAVLYCNARSKAEGEDTVYTYSSISGIPGYGCTSLVNIANDFLKNGYRLPTEAEWEYACRAGTTMEYYWGDTMNTNYCWFRGQYSYNPATTSVATKLPNEFGLYDMSGNVMEWCNDRYARYNDSAQIDPMGGTTSTHNRVVRGGTCIGDPLRLHSAYRSYQFAEAGSWCNGFRCTRRQ